MANIFNIECRRYNLHATTLFTPPRSIFLMHSYNEKGDYNNFQRRNEFANLFGAPSSEWAGEFMTLPADTPFATDVGIWRQPRAPLETPEASYYATQDFCSYRPVENWCEHTREPGQSAAIATRHGIISLWLRDRVRVDMTIDQAVRIINFKNNIIMSLSSSGSAAALLHPSGRIYQHGSHVEILVSDVHGNNKYAEMWHKGVSFTAEHCALVYLVDAAGIRTTTHNFSDMSQDFPLSVFYYDSHHGQSHVQEANYILQASQYWITDEGTENWIINNVRISQTADGLVRIYRNSNKYKVHTSPASGTASLTTPFLHCTASLGKTAHLFVRRGERRMHYDGSNFIVRNAGHSAGFDERNQVKVY